MEVADRQQVGFRLGGIAPPIPAEVLPNRRTRSAEEIRHLMARLRLISSRMMLTLKRPSFMLVRMMTPSPQNSPVVSDPMEQIRKRFTERCRGDLEQLRNLRSSGAYGGDAEAISVLAGIAHSLAGAGGTLGFPEISNRAFEVESVLIEGGGGDQATAALDQLIKALEVVSDPPR